WFMQNFSEDFLRGAVMAGELRISAGTGAEPWIDTEDVAEVMVAALLDPKHIGETYSLSGPRALTLDEVAGELASATGRPIRYVGLEPGRFVAELLGHGVPQEVAEALRDLCTVIREHRSEHLSGGVQKVLGREPRDFADWARRTARAGTWSV